jgi:hypothetical protein
MSGVIDAARNPTRAVGSAKMRAEQKADTNSGKRVLRGQETRLKKPV